MGTDSGGTLTAEVQGDRVGVSKWGKGGTTITEQQ